MVVAMGAFALADTFIKLLAGTMAPAQVMFLLMGGGLIVFATIALIQRESLTDRRALAPALLVRYVAEVAGVIGIVMALALVPISTFGAIVQATPLVVVLGAVLLLGEKVSWRRWSAIGVGFFGVLLIVQPGTAGFDINVLWAVLGMFGLSGRDLTTRLAPADMGPAALSTFTMVASMPVATGWVVASGLPLFPPEANWLIVIAMVLSGCVGYLLLIASIRTTDISIVAPFRYSRLIYLLFFGMVVFGERPDFWMLFGATLIVVSGLYIMWRERQTKQEKKV